jgi:hypothetical protein
MWADEWSARQYGKLERRPNMKEYEKRILIDAVLAEVCRGGRRTRSGSESDTDDDQQTPPRALLGTTPRLGGISVARFRIPPFVSFEEPAVAVTLSSGVGRGRRPGRDRARATRAGPPPIYWT